MVLSSHRIVFSRKIFACFRFPSNIFTFITCPVNSFILWDEFSVEKSVIWVVFGKQRSVIVMRLLPLPLAMGRKFDTFITLSHYALIANPIIPKNPKLFAPHQFSVKFMSKKVDKLKKILVLHPKLRNQR